MSCPHCGHEGKPLKAYKPRPSTKRTTMCAACFGEVERPGDRPVVRSMREALDLYTDDIDPVVSDVE